MKKKRIGIIGFGEMGKRHAKEFDEATGGLLELAGVYEPGDLNYKKGCEWTGATPKRYNSPEELIKNGGLDGIIISSPNCFHLENLRLLKGEKMTVLLEKPLDSGLDKICEIVRFAQSYKGPMIVDHVMRYAPIVRRGRQMIEDGLLGKVCSLHFIQRHGGGALFQTFRRTLKEGGGQMVEKATHDLDVMLFWAGAAPRRVAAFGRHHLYGGDKPNDLRCSTCDEAISCDSVTHVGRQESASVKDVSMSNDLCAYAKCVDVYDNETCMIEMDNNIFGTYSHCYFCDTDYTREYEVIGTKGTMKASFSGNPDGVLKFYPRDRSGEIQTYKFNYHGKIHYLGGPYVGKHFYELMCGAAKPFTTVNQAFVAEMLSCAAMEAQAKNSFVKIEDIIPEDLRPAYNSTYAGN